MARIGPTDGRPSREVARPGPVAAGLHDQPDFAFDAGGSRRHLETIAGSALLRLTAVPLRLGPDHRPATPGRFIPVPTGPLRAFLLTQRPPER